MSQKWDPAQLRWMRRYAGRRWVLGVTVEAEPIGTMVDSLIALDIAVQRAFQRTVKRAHESAG